MRERVAQFAEAGVTILNVSPVARTLDGQKEMIAKVKEMCS